MTDTNGYGKYAAPDNEPRDARFPLSGSLDETTSHSTKLPKPAAKSLVTPVGESDLVSLRDVHVKSCFVKRPSLFSRVLRNTILGVTAAWLAVLPQPLFAASFCSFTSVTSVSFGTYNVFSALPNASGVGSINVFCESGGGPSFVVTLSTGQSNTYSSRVMRSGGNSLNYNLYTSAVRTVVWGDGTGGSSVMTAAKQSTTTLSVFGQIPAGQDATVGTYTDNIIVIVSF